MRGGACLSRTAYLAAWAKRKREELIVTLGGKCVLCGAIRRLEFDHIDGRRTWVAAKTSRWQRIINYAREAKAGLIQLLCRRCNAQKG